jgi:tetratricopeptide (TPR) repeat protein
MQRLLRWQAFILAAGLILTPLPAWAGANLQQLLQMGADALKTGNSFLATQKYQEAVNQNPQSHQAWYRLAEAQYKSKNYKDAIKSVSKAIQLAPDQPLLLAKYHTGRAWACYQAGLYGQAVVDMERATELAPNNRQYQNWLNGARQKEQQKGPGPSLSSVLGYEEMQRSSGGGQEMESRQEEQQQPFGEEASQDSTGESQDRQGRQGRQARQGKQEESSGESQYREDDSETRGQREETGGSERSQEEGSREASASQGEDDSAGGGGNLSSRCRKSYFVCMAGCADIQSSDSRAICEKACRSAAQACQ